MQRRARLSNEGAAIDPAQIAEPVLIVHARDDWNTPFSAAAFTVERIPEARFLALETGGYLLLGRHAEVRQRIASFLASLPP